MINSLKPALIIIFALFLFSCKKNGVEFEQSIITDSGPLAEKTVVGKIDEISVATGIAAEIVKSNDEKVIVSAPKNIIDEVDATIENGKLSLRIKQGIRIKNIEGVRAKIFVKDFKRVKASSAAVIKIKDKFLLETVEIDVSSSGSIKGDVEANEMSIDASSAGNFSGKIWAINLTTDSSSSGRISISGKSKKTMCSVSSGGGVSGKNFTTDDGNLDVSSGGQIVLGINQALTAEASSGGSIEYIERKKLLKIDRNENSGGSIRAIQ